MWKQTQTKVSKNTVLDPENRLVDTRKSIGANVKRGPLYGDGKKLDILLWSPCNKDRCQL